MDRTQLEQAVLALVLAPDYKAVKPRTIGERLDLSDDDLQAVKMAVKRLVKAGKLEYGSNHLVRPPRQTSRNQLTGTFRRTQAGYGFVRPAGTAPSAGNTLDIYIPEDRAADAASGDVVLVELNLKKLTSRGNPEGQILEVIERDTHQFVGTYFEAAGQSFVQVDGGMFSKPIAVGDPGAKNANADDKVVFEMVRFPSPWHDGEGVITEVLGPKGQPGIDTLSIIREFELPEDFAEDALEEAREETENFDETIHGHRTDLTGETVITIDPVDARDFDDAISLELIERGHWRLGVHIADVSHFVRPRTALDREAYNRATSVYLPDRVLPMIPELISNGLASLQPDRVRYTKTVFIEFTPDGAPIASDLHSAAIRSRRRFTYEEVDEYLADPEDWKAKLATQVHSLLGRMHTLAMILRKRRIQRGALELSMSEVKIDLDRDGNVTGAHKVVNTVSHQIIEEFMLAANEAVAEFLHAQELLFLRRVHGAPDPRKLKELTEFTTELGFQTESLESRFELQRLLDYVAGRPEQQAVNYAVLRSLQRAVYSPAVEGHYALASECYCHFTSPIRRYPDLTIHRLIDAVLRHKKPVQELGELVAAGEHCSERERRAEAAERELTKVKLLNFLASRIGLEMEAVVTGATEFGLFVQGVQLPAEGLVHISTLADDYYRYERKSHSLIGFRAGHSYRLGDPLQVVVARVDVDRRELDFRIVARRKRGETDQTEAVANETSRRRPAKSKSGKKDRPGGNRSKKRGR